MGAGHAHQGLLVAGESPLHRLRPECKMAATILFVFAVVAAPREAFWAYAVFATIVVALAQMAGLGLLRLARRLTIELPFVGFALLLPFVSRGDRIDVLGLSVSSDGLWAAWNVLVKGTIGVAATTVLAASTPVAAMITGLERLRMPRIITAITGFMVRYGEVLTAEADRMRVARLARGYDPRWFWQSKAVITSAGALFVRSYERGERVYLAMVARGFDGTMPDTETEAPAAPGDWARALSVPVVAALVTATAWALR
jgi:cobalt/nickel transport system permease protein